MLAYSFLGLFHLYFIALNLFLCKNIALIFSELSIILIYFLLFIWIVNIFYQ